MSIEKEYENLELLLSQEKRPFEFLEQILAKCPTVASDIEDMSGHDILRAFEENNVSKMEDLAYEAKQWARSAREDMQISAHYGE